MLISTPEKLEFRLKARSYFIDVNLLPVLEAIKRENDEATGDDKDENLEKQLDVFYDHMDEDEDEAREIQNNLQLQLEYHNSLYTLVYPLIPK